MKILFDTNVYIAEALLGEIFEQKACSVVDASQRERFYYRRVTASAFGVR